MIATDNKRGGIASRHFTPCVVIMSYRYDRRTFQLVVYRVP